MKADLAYRKARQPSRWPTVLSKLYVWHSSYKMTVPSLGITMVLLASKIRSLKARPCVVLDTPKYRLGLLTYLGML